MRNKVKFIPEPEFNKNVLLPSSTLAVYDSSVEGAISLVMLTEDGFVQAGTRLTHFQASGLARTLVNLLGTEDDDPHALGFDLGYTVGHHEGNSSGYARGFEHGYDEGSSDGWNDGHELGYERGFEDGQEEVA